MVLFLMNPNSLVCKLRRSQNIFEMVENLFIIATEFKALRRIQSGLFTFTRKAFCTNLEESAIVGSVLLYGDNSNKKVAGWAERVVTGIKTILCYTKLVFNPLYMKLI